MHPGVNGILVTPICPHSLSFRPLIVPENLELKIIVSSSNRGNVWVRTKILIFLIVFVFRFHLTEDLGLNLDLMIFL